MSRTTPAAQRARYQRLKTAGQCVTCLQPVSGRARCAACRQDKAVATRRWRDRQRAQGRCDQCGQQPAIPGKGRCVACTLREGR